MKIFHVNIRIKVIVLTILTILFIFMFIGLIKHSYNCYSFENMAIFSEHDNFARTELTAIQRWKDKKVCFQVDYYNEQNVLIDSISACMDKQKIMEKPKIVYIES